MLFLQRTNFNKKIILLSLNLASFPNTSPTTTSFSQSWLSSDVPDVLFSLLRICQSLIRVSRSAWKHDNRLTCEGESHNWRLSHTIQSLLQHGGKLLRLQQHCLLPELC